MVYFLKDGKYAERWPYQRLAAESKKQMTVLTADKQYIDWGSFRQAEMQEEKVILTNAGTDTLIYQCHRIILRMYHCTMDGFSCPTRQVYHFDGLFSGGRKGGI